MQAVLCALQFMYNFIQIYLQMRIAYYNSTPIITAHMHIYVRHHIYCTHQSYIYIKWSAVELSLKTLKRRISGGPWSAVNSAGPSSPAGATEVAGARYTSTGQPLNRHSSTAEAVSTNYCYLNPPRIGSRGWIHIIRRGILVIVGSISVLQLKSWTHPHSPTGPPLLY